MGLCEMGLDMDNLKLKGRSTVRAFRAGVIPYLMDSGMTLQEAVQFAKHAGFCVHENIVDNLVVTAGKVLVADFLVGESRTGLNYHAIGTSTTAPAASDTQLGTETARKAFTSIARSSTSVVVSVFYTAAQSTFNIKEGGIFGNGATGAADSGTLFSHFSQSEDNSAGLNDLTFDYELLLR